MSAIDDPSLPARVLEPAIEPEVDLAPTPREPRTSGLFRAFWRWHFYASLLVLPVLLVLAVTGLIYLFRFQIEPALHHDLMRVSGPLHAGDLPTAIDPQREAVAAKYPDASIDSVTEPANEHESTRFSLTLADGSARDVYVNPWTIRVLGDLDPDTTVSGIAIRLHGELMAGRWGDAVIELGACWAVVMTLTGYYLFWRGRVGRARRRAAAAAGAALRSRHAMVGAVVGGGILLLVVSGLPWTGVWGSKVQQLSTHQGTSMWSQDPGAISNPATTMDESLPHSHDVPWAQGKSGVPTSTPGPSRSVANADTAILAGQQHGLRHPMTVVLPRQDTGVFSVIGYAFNDPGQERTVHVDRFDGHVISQYGYRDYPGIAKVVSQGIALHEGRRFGLLNLWATTAFCLAVVFLCLSAPLMWWRRRPTGSRTASAPRGRMPLRATPALAVALVGLGVFLPLFGASLCLVLVLDQLVLRRSPALRRWLNIT